MKMRKASVLLLLASSLLSSCNNDSKKLLLANSNFTLYGEIDKNNLFLTPSLNEFTNLYNSNLSYIVLFSQPNCPACEQFEPIIEKYVEKNHQLVVKINGDDRYKIENEYREKFFPGEKIIYPSLFIKENNDNIVRVDRSSYMRTYGAFNNHLNSIYKTSKCAYFCGEITAKTPIISKYTVVNFQSNEAYKNKIFTKLMNTEKDVVISTNFEDNFMTVFEKESSGNFAIARTTPITNDLDEETIDKYL